MVIQRNMQALNTVRQLGINTNAMHKSTEKLSSGYKINRSADDAAGLSISEKMRRQVKGLSKASYNAQNGITFCQVADGSLEEVHDMVKRIKELAVQATNGTYMAEDREYLNEEVQQITDEIDRIHENITFNAMNVFKDTPAGGGAADNFDLQVGMEEGITVNVQQFDISANALFKGNAIDISTVQAANSTLEHVDEADASVSEIRSYYGALQNRLEHTVYSLDNVTENTTSSESQIRDTNIADETFRFYNNRIINQAVFAMLSQANQAPAGVLKLLQ